LSQNTILVGFHHRSENNHSRGICDRWTTPVWTNWTLVQTDDQQVGLIKVNPIVWSYQWGLITNPTKTDWRMGWWAVKTALTQQKIWLQINHLML